MRDSRLTEQISEATPDDHAGMSSVILRCLYEVNSADYPSEVIDDLAERHGADSLGDFLEGKYALVVKRGGRVIGTGVLEGSEITTVFVDPDIHRGGVGKRIMHALETEAAKRGLPHVEVHASLTAVKFYEALGYKELERVSREVGGESFHMRKNLEPFQI